VGYLEDNIKTDLKVECHIMDSIQRPWGRDQREGALGKVMEPYAVQNIEDEILKYCQLADIYMLCFQTILKYNHSLKATIR
jgi:hypothetical protein